MIQIAIRGRAAVFDPSTDSQVVDPEALSSLDGLVYNDECFTDYLGGFPAEDALAAALDRGGDLRFRYCSGEDVLRVETIYRSRRPLTQEELDCLLEYTLGQWSDGIGENWACESAARCRFTIMCLTPSDGENPSIETRASLT